MVECRRHKKLVPKAPRRGPVECQRRKSWDADTEVGWVWGGVSSAPLVKELEGGCAPSQKMFWLLSGKWCILGAIFAYSSNLELYWLLCFTVGRYQCPSPEILTSEWKMVHFGIWLLFLQSAVIIDFPNLGLIYNGGWCTATKTRWNSLLRAFLRS